MRRSGSRHCPPPPGRAAPQCVEEIPAHDFSAVPVDDGGEIHVAAVEPDVGDIDGPDPIWEGNLLVSQQIWDDRLL